MNRENLKYILDVVRRTTKIVKLFPFLYIALFLILTPLMAFGTITYTEEVGGFIALSPITVAFLILLSYSVKLCFWHRLQCSLPLIPQIADFIDTHIYEYGEALAVINFVLLLLLFSFSLVNAYFVFIRPTRKSIF